LVEASESSAANTAGDKAGIRRLEDLRVNVLLEVDPRSEYELFLKSYADRCVSGGRTVFAFTPEGSPLHRMLEGTNGVELVLLSMSAEDSHRDGEPLGRVSVVNLDRATFLTVLDSLVATKGKVVVFLDSISSLVMAQGFQETYRLLRQSIEIVGRVAGSRISALVVMIKGAHSEVEQMIIRSVFPVLMDYNASGLSVVKPRSLMLTGEADPIQTERRPGYPPSRRHKEKRSARETRLEILGSIANEPRSVTEVMRVCNATWTTVLATLYRLQEKGLISVESAGQKKSYVATPAGREVAETYDRIANSTD
jgi:predicted transcriptional regulator